MFVQARYVSGGEESLTGCNSIGDVKCKIASRNDDFLAPDITLLDGSIELTEDAAPPPSECTVVIRKSDYNDSVLTQALAMHACACDLTGIDRAMALLKPDWDYTASKAAQACGVALVSVVYRRGSFEESACMLVKARADVNCRKDGSSALIGATSKGYGRLVRMLLGASARVGDTNRHGETALHVAVQSGNEELALALLDAGAKADERDVNKRTPLGIAAQHGHVALAQALLTRGANVNNRNAAEETPLHVVSQYCGSPDLARVLLDANALVDAKNHAQETPLHLAASKGHTPLVQVLLDAKADVHSQDDDQCGVLHRAAQGGEEGVVRLLVKSQAIINRRNSAGETPLQVALRLDNVAAACALLGAKARVEEKDKDQCAEFRRRHREASNGCLCC